MLDQEAAYVTLIAAGDAQLILDGGFEVKRTAAPLGLFPAPVISIAKAGKYEGTIDLVLERMKGVSYYQIHMTPDDATHTDARWQMVCSTTRCRNTITGLERFKVYSFRVTAHGTAGASPASAVKLGRAA